ncbi:MAG: adenylate/guanylate cyclase domain-containing protein [Geminicoccaceae bacterium]|nr:adenylate/guanylate cyclase domain-containing protein [Geminicoccaceae bacterium]HRY23198.1 adenylate/guanylate cyclase domain-containing protein [Geminicoccaceae bacterium]
MTAERTIRRLAAILVADVVGYSRLMAEDETAALAALNRHREVEFDPIVARHNGRIVKLMGDGTLVEFRSVVDAVTCAVAIQTAAVAPGSSPAMMLRIGVHLGDIIIQGDDIYGDGVNIAARLEPRAAAGGVCVSSVVNESLRDRVDTVFVDGGDVAVKNLARPVRVWHWHPGDGSAPAPAVPPPARASEGRSIAVLAFANMSGDAEQEYFSDGIAEDIITDLSKVAGLLVIARNSSFAYKGRSVDLRDVGRELGVGHVLEGSVRRAGGRVRITAQLIDTATGGHLWADRYDRELTDVFAVQDEVTLKIVDALRVRLSPAERADIVAAGTTSMEAHDCFLRMRNLIFSPGLTPALWQRGIAEGLRAIELDPTYVQARALTSICHWLDFHNGWSGNAPEVVAARARALADRAIELDPADPFANHAIAVAARWQGDYDLAAEAIDRTLAKNPDYALGLFTRSEIALAAGRHTDAIADLEHATRVDPAWTHQYLQNMGMAHLLLGHVETAALILRERLLLARDTDIGRAWLASALGHLGEIEEARRLWAELLEINPSFSIEQRLARQRFARRADIDQVMAGLARAGLPVGP